MARKDKDRVGDVLGLGDVTPEQPLDTGLPEVGMRQDTEEARRRHRMSEGADEVTPAATPPHRGAGATGIDMGSGGEGTDVE